MEAEKFKTVKEYFAAYPKNIRDVLELLRNKRKNEYQLHTACGWIVEIPKVKRGFLPKLHLFYIFYPYWRDGRAVEGARLESAYTPKVYRGFESLSLRQLSRGTELFCPLVNSSLYV